MGFWDLSGIFWSSESFIHEFTAILEVAVSADSSFSITGKQ